MTENKQKNIWRCPECHSTTEEKIKTSDGTHLCKSCFRELPSYKDGTENICFCCNCAFSTDKLVNIDNEYLACKACIEKGGSEETPIFICRPETSSEHYSTERCYLCGDSDDQEFPHYEEHRFKCYICKAYVKTVYEINQCSVCA